MLFSVNSLAVFTQNTLATNGLSLNGLSLNGMRMNGLTTNGVTLNGVTLNGMRMNGIAVNKLPYPSVNNLPQPVFNNGFNGIHTHGLIGKKKRSITSLVPTGLVPTLLDSQSPNRFKLIPTGLELTPQGREKLTYLISCALNEGIELYTEVEGKVYIFLGSMGLAPRWLEQALTSSV